MVRHVGKTEHNRGNSPDESTAASSPLDEASRNLAAQKLYEQMQALNERRAALGPFQTRERRRILREMEELFDTLPDGGAQRGQRERNAVK